jgi:methylmalonyl-CoA epimerase
MLGKNCLLDHVAIAVTDLEKAVTTYEAMGLRFKEEREIVKSQGVRTAFAQIDENAQLELLGVYGEEGPILSFLEKKGPGIHHLCFKVPDIEAKCKELKEKGFRLLYEKPIQGAHSCMVNFIHPKSTGGVLIEISQKVGEI